MSGQGAAEAEQPTPEGVIAAAEAEEKEAAELLHALEDRVRDGDETVQPEQIEKARGLRRFAQLRREVAARRAEKLKQQQIDNLAAERRDAFLAEIAPHDITRVPELQRQITDALAELLELCEAYDQVVLKHANGLASGGRQTTLPIRGDFDGVKAWIELDGKMYRRPGGKNLADNAVNAGRQRHFKAVQERAQQRRERAAKGRL
ncbi:hypothetical protein [Streptomyces aidingensis]|uniref:Uncharacterized protein n=1 Tax=Streptomyces aidingensis TaxID=910347 RepID=A0A1I1TTD8_9ACTN|nr:hypothetical protein [Streptomyces aidingensis]SFD61842.1 hypothetical protein SAMN05421773_12124 [Streptomyces aidingensis]